MNDKSVGNDQEEADECCNSGCNNCILDIRQQQQSKIINREQKNNINIFDGVYRTFRLLSMETLTENVRKYRFKFVPCDLSIELGNYVIEIPPTFHLFIRAPSTEENASKHDKNTKENYISRPYTPIQFNSSELTFDILIKFEPNGQMSNHFRSMRLDDLSEWKGSYGEFEWKSNSLSYKYLVCICQGVAIAPMFSLIASILSNDCDETLVYLIACFKNLENCLLRVELTECRKYWNFKSINYLSQQEQCSQCANKIIENCICLRSKLRFNEIIRNYRLDYKELITFYRSLNSNLVFTLFCGTNRLESTVETCIEELKDDNIRRNCFYLK